MTRDEPKENFTQRCCEASLDHAPMTSCGVRTGGHIDIFDGRSGYADQVSSLRFLTVAADEVAATFPRAGAFSAGSQAAAARLA